MTEISFGRILSARAASNPDQVVIMHNDEVWTASAFHRWTNRLARPGVAACAGAVFAED